MNGPLVSIIIPVKNGRRYLPEALAGIRRQCVNDLEIIAVDDASDDGTGEFAKAQGCVVVGNGISLGPVKSRNAGLKAATGKFILFQDHDDVMLEGALKRLIDELIADSSIMAVRGQTRDFISPEIGECEAAKINCRQKPYFGVVAGTTLMRREVWDVLGGFDESVRAGETLDWTQKMESHGFKIKSLEFVAVARRLHLNNFSRTNKSDQFADYAKLLRRRLMTRSGRHP